MRRSFDMAKLLALPLEANPSSVISKFETTACLYDEARHYAYKWARGILNLPS